MTKVTTLKCLAIGMALTSGITIASEQRVTGGENAYYIAGETTPIQSNVQFQWPESRFKGGDGHDGPQESEAAFDVYVIHEQYQGGNMQ